MKSTPATLSLDPLKPPTQRMWRVALGYFALAAVLGALLRFLTLHPVPGLHAGHLLHTHSHIAFLGWVFNACFVLGLTAFPGQRPGKQWRRLWVVLQVGVIGMLVSYPIQGYGPISIAFSTLHMGASAVFAWWLWRATGASTAARPHLRVALAALVLSGLGPLALGPLAALDLRDSPGYTLAIYFYLHAHYNGWFVFFLQAIAVQAAGKAVDRKKALRAAQWLAAGLVLTFAQSTLWLDPPSWVRLLAGIGGGMQLIGAVLLAQVLWPARKRLPSGIGRWLVVLAIASWGLKLVLQALAALPALATLANHRYIAIAFLHLIFLGLVTPGLLAAALHRRWLPDDKLTQLILGLFFTGALLGQLALVALPLGVFPTMWSPLHVLAWTAAGSAAAAVALCCRQPALPPPATSNREPS